MVLPLLQTSVDNLPQKLLTAYAAAQAIPGPMFTIASFLGAKVTTSHPLIGASIATVAIFTQVYCLCGPSLINGNCYHAEVCQH